MLEFVKNGIILNSELNIILKEVEKYKGRATPAEISTTLNVKKEYFRGIDSSVRTGKVYFPEPIESKNVYNILQSHIMEKYINFPFKFTNISVIQYSFYGAEDFFNWHTDFGYHNVDTAGRSFSMSLNISASDSYTGGAFQLLYNNRIIELDRTPGSYIIFPSFLPHQVSKIISGIRESIVVWVQSSLEEIKFLDNLFRHHHAVKN